MTDVPPPVAHPIRPEFSEKTDQVVTAVTNIKKRVREVPKTGKHKTEGYKFVKWIDVMATVQVAEADEGILFEQREIRRAIAGQILFITYEFDLLHVSGQYIKGHCCVTGAARHQYEKGTYNDKAANICLVTALKYATIVTYRIPPEDAVVIRDFPDLEEDEDRGGSGGVRKPRDRDDRNGDPPDRDGDDADRHHDGTPSDEQLARGDRELRDKVQRLRERLNEATTVYEADGIWRDYRNVLEVVSNATYNDLKDKYRDRWREEPPVIPAAPSQREETS